MKRLNLDLRRIVVPFIALATVATLVTGAHADRGGHRYKGDKGRQYSSYRGPGGFTVRRQVIAPRSYGGYYGGYRYARSPRVYVRSYPSYPRFGTYLIRRPVSGGFLCGPVGGGLSFSLTLGNVLPGGAYYYDPYCHQEFASLSTYYAHCQGHHAAQVRVCERDNGYYGDGGYDRGYDDDGYYDDRYDDDYYRNRPDGYDDECDDDGGWRKN